MTYEILAGTPISRYNTVEQSWTDFRTTRTVVYDKEDVLGVYIAIKKKVTVLETSLTLTPGISDYTKRKIQTFLSFRQGANWLFFQLPSEATPFSMIAVLAIDVK